MDTVFEGSWGARPLIGWQKFENIAKVVEDSISCPTLIQARFGERAVQKLRLALHHSTELAYNWWITSDDPVRAARRMLILLLPGDKVGWLKLVAASSSSHFDFSNNFCAWFDEACIKLVEELVATA